MTLPEPPFAEPWQARLWALTQRLAEAGLFDWPGWAQAFGAALARARAAGGPEDGANYYDLWLETLEALLAERGIAPAEVDAMAEAWERAYLATPHGAPVRLGS